MKKTYINPQTVIVRIQTQQMIANSFKAAFGEGTKGGGEAASRGSGDFLWDDDDEE